MVFNIHFLKYYFFVLLLAKTTALSGQVISIAQSQKDSMMFGESTIISFSINQLPDACKSVVIDLSKIENQLYETDSIMFEKYADVLVDFGDADLLNYFDEGAQKITIPAQIFPAKENQAIKVALKFLSYGSFVIPPATLQDANGPMNAQSTPAHIMVRLQNEVIADSTLTISDIKPIIEVKPSIWSWLRYVLLLILLGGIAYYLYRRYQILKQNKSLVLPEIEKIVILPHITALQELHKLKSSQSWKEGKIKDFQTDLTFIIRKYIEARFNFGALEMTSDEVTTTLRKKNVVSKTWSAVIDDVLHIADLVKFAKAQPDDSIHEDFVDKAIDFVEATKSEI